MLLIAHSTSAQPVRRRIRPIGTLSVIRDHRRAVGAAQHCAVVPLSATPRAGRWIVQATERQREFLRPDALIQVPQTEHRHGAQQRAFLNARDARNRQQVSISHSQIQFRRQRMCASSIIPRQRPGLGTRCLRADGRSSTALWAGFKPGLPLAHSAQWRRLNAHDLHWYRCDPQLIRVNGLRRLLIARPPPCADEVTLLGAESPSHAAAMSLRPARAHLSRTPAARGGPAKSRIVPIERRIPLQITQRRPIAFRVSALAPRPIGVGAGRPAVQQQQRWPTAGDRRRWHR